MPCDPLRERLLKAGIAPRHVRRYLRELADHLEDLAAAQREAGHDKESALSRARAQLGQDEDLAAAMLARPELKSWTARAPWLVFGVAPPIIMVAAVFGLTSPLILTSTLHGWMDHPGMAAPDWFRAWAKATGLLSNLALGPGLTCLLMLIAKRQWMNWKWPVLAGAVLAVADFHLVMRFPPPGQHGGQIAITVLGELAGPPFPMTGPLWGVQFLLTLAPLLWLWRTQWFAHQPELR